jgi:hypothetical protein
MTQSRLMMPGRASETTEITMKQEVSRSEIDIEASCCKQPRFNSDNISLISKLHQARGYVTYACSACGTEHQKDYRLSHKEVDGEILDKNSTNIASPNGESSCDHIFVGNQVDVLAENEFRVESTCSECGVVVWDIFRRM